MLRVLLLIFNVISILPILNALQINTFKKNILSKKATVVRYENVNSIDLGEEKFIDSTSETKETFFYHTLPNIERVFCLSDLHTDHSTNLKWLEEKLAESDLNFDDLVIVAGDISHKFSTLEESLRLLRSKCQVFFIPGNHETWIDKRHDTFNSIEKLNRVEQLCRRYGCYVDPIYIEGNHPLWIVPLHSWYDGSLSFDEQLSKGFCSWPWTDFSRCVWPDDCFPLEDINSQNARIPKGLAKHYINSNKKSLQFIISTLLQRRKTNSMPKNQIGFVTVSHFLPNQQCLPDWKDLQSLVFDSAKWLDHGAGDMSAKFAKVAGSSLLDDQIRSLFLNHSEANVRQIHVFGHSHRPKDFEYKGIRYVHNPLGKPRERQSYMISPNVDFKIIWNTCDNGEKSSCQIIRFWEDVRRDKINLQEKSAIFQSDEYSKQRTFKDQ